MEITRLMARAHAVRPCPSQPAARLPNGPMGAFVLVGAKAKGCEIVHIYSKASTQP